MSTLLDIYRDGFPEDGDVFSGRFVADNADRAVTYSVGGRAVAAGYLLPKTLSAGGAEYSAYYLDAFSVLTQYRGTGVAQKLMRLLLDKAAADGAGYVFLSPFNGTYYRQYGFADAVYAEKTFITGGAAIPVRKASSDDVRRVYERMTSAADIYFVRKPRFYAECAFDHFLIGDGEGFAAGNIWNGEFEVTACTDYAALLSCDFLKGLFAYVPGTGKPFVQVYDPSAPGVNPFRGKIAITDKL